MMNRKTNWNDDVAVRWPALVGSDEIQRVPYERLRMDGENVRTVYEPGALAELAESLVENGFLQNLECDESGTVHIGNRRLKALSEIVVPRLVGEIGAAMLVIDEGNEESDPAVMTEWHNRLAGLEGKLESLRRPPVRVLSREMGLDRKIRQLVENLQRVDISPLDEARGYDYLLSLKDGDGKALWSPESVAARIGKTRGGKELTGWYVRQRRKLLLAPKGLRDALENGAVPLKVCLLVARVPNGKDREELGRRVLNPKHLDRPLSEGETLELIREEYMVSLRGAPFDLEDGSLVPAAGGCGACGFRSGNDPDLAGDLQAGANKGGILPDVCTNPGCYREKCGAGWRAIVDRAEVEGYGVLSPEAAGKEFAGPNGGLTFHSLYVDLDDKPTGREAGTYDERKVRPWRKLLEGSGCRVTKARHPRSGRIHDLVEKAVARLALERKRVAEVSGVAAAAATGGEAGELSGMAGVSVSSVGDGVLPGFAAGGKESEEEAKARKAEERRLVREGRLAAIGLFDRVADAMTADKGQPLPDAALRFGLEVALNASADGCAWFAEWLELERPKPGASGRDFLPLILAVVENRKPAWSPWEMVALMILAVVAPGVKYHGAPDADLQRLCAIFGVKGKAGSGKAGSGKVKGGKVKGEDMELLADAAAFYAEQAALGEGVSVKEAADACGVNAGALAGWLVRTGVLPEVLPLEPGDDGEVSRGGAEGAEPGELSGKAAVLAADAWAVESGGAVAEAEARFGLKRNQLANFRKNRNRLAKAAK